MYLAPSDLEANKFIVVIFSHGFANISLFKSISRKNLQWCLLVTDDSVEVKHLQEVDYLNFLRILLQLWLFFGGLEYCNLRPNSIFPLKSFPAVLALHLSTFYCVVNTVLFIWHTS